MGFSVSTPDGFELKVTLTLDLVLNRCSLKKKMCSRYNFESIITKFYFILFQISAFRFDP